jgi:ribosomal protein S27AE
MDCCSPDREVVVEVRRLVVDGRTCARCGDAWDAALHAVRETEGELAGAGTRVRLVERPLPPERIAESNSVLVDGRPVEEWLAGEVSAGTSECPSCSDIVGLPVCCRTYEIAGEPAEALSADAIARAIRRAAGVPEPASARALRVLIVTTPECG